MEIKIELNLKNTAKNHNFSYYGMVQACVDGSHTKTT